MSVTQQYLTYVTLHYITFLSRNYWSFQSNKTVACIEFNTSVFIAYELKFYLTTKVFFFL